MSLLLSAGFVLALFSLRQSYNLNRQEESRLNRQDAKRAKQGKGKAGLNRQVAQEHNEKGLTHRGGLRPDDRAIAATGSVLSQWKCPESNRGPEESTPRIYKFSYAIDFAAGNPAQRGLTWRYPILS